MLPSKKITILSVVCLVVIGGVIYYKVKPGSSLVSKPLSLTEVQSSSSSGGLATLQSKVAASQHPLENASYAEPSITAAISQDFAQNYLTLQKSESLSIESQAQLIQNIAKTYATSSSITLSLKDIKTFPDTDLIQGRAFGNATAKAVFNYYETLKVSPLDIIAAADRSTTTLTSKLMPIATAYRSLALDLQKIAAPDDLAQEYLDVINGYANLGDAVEDMSYRFSDPVRGFMGLNNYQSNLYGQLDLLKNVAVYFSYNDILFSNGEDGVLWSSLEF